MEFQSWCEFRVAGRGQNDSHRKTSNADTEPSGQDLDKAADLEVRREEIRRLEVLKALEWAPEDQARGKRLIRSRWEDVEKFDPRKPKVRSRWVLQNFAVSKAAEFCSATPCLAAARLLEAVAVERQWRTQGADVSVAFMHADEEYVYPVPLDGWQRPGFARRLLKNIHGRRAGAKCWFECATCA